MPRQGEVYPPGEPILLIGMGQDAEEGTLPESSLTWDSDALGFLGEGREILVEGLAPGPHTLVLTARDGDGMVGEATVEIFIGESLRLPLILRG